MQPTIKAAKSGGEQLLLDRLRRLQRLEVVVGWTGAKSSRQGESITNPELAFIHTNGSPLRGIPARPILQPALTVPATQTLLTTSMAEAAAFAANGDPEAAEKQLKKTGLLAENAVKRFFTTSGNGTWAPNAPSTIARKGSSKPLIDTAQLRNSVVSVVREKKT